MNQTEQKFSFDLPPFPATASKLVNEINCPEVKVHRVVELIECEPTIAAKVLQLANSPLYGASRSITAIGHAVVLLGFKSVSQLALTVATGSLFKSGDAACLRAKTETYRQSLGIATVARIYARKTRTANPEEAFLSGIMHDVGKLVLFNEAGEDYAAMLNNSPTGDTCDIELATFGVNHASLGQSCAREWGMPPAIAEAIRNHHCPIQDVIDELTRSLVVAHTLTRAWNIGFDEPIDLSREVKPLLVGDFDESAKDECVEQFEAISQVCL